MDERLPPLLLLVLAAFVGTAAWRGDPAAADAVAGREPLSAVVDSPVRQVSAAPKLPMTLPPLAIEPGAGRDPFNLASAPPSLPAPKVQPPAPRTLASTIGPPSSPSLPLPQWRFFGRLTAPGGETIVLLTRGNQPAAATAGLRLDDGLVVAAVEPNAVRLRRDDGLVWEVPLPAP